MITRRSFLKQSTLFAAGAYFHGQLPPAMRHHPIAKQQVAFDTGKLEKWVDPLPVPAVAQAQGKRPSPADQRLMVPYYRMSMRQTDIKVHRDMKPTRWWACASSVPGATIDARSGEPLLIEWANELPQEHFLPIDHNLHGAEADKPQVRTVVHVHGAKVRPQDDGYPEDWVVSGKSNVFYYPNQQDPAMLWYHDHAMGINRLNIYAGMLGSYIVRDKFEDELNLPKGKYEIPLVIFDRDFTLDHQLLYPISGNADAPWVPEVYGESILANGKLFPYCDVEPRKYRFRILNGSNSRTYRFSFGDDIQFHQIGTDQGFLSAPVPMKKLILAPAERADIIVNFSGHGGEKIIFKNDSFSILQFRVSASKVNDESALPATLRPVPKLKEADAVKTRMLTLNEYENPVGESMIMLLNGTYWHQPITEKPVINTTEIWSFVNPTDDTHPIHIHLVKFQILDRKQYIPGYPSDTDTKHLQTFGEATPPDPSEAGWKDTVRAEPRAITRIIIPFEGYTGRYVWHCHLLEHEDNEMMRPYEVVASAAQSQSTPEPTHPSH
ncbi:MAG: multicopper oxidase [Acidobacteriota bacterium]|nr:multicopper oxidase [Acidobacteriota bacterium]